MHVHARAHCSQVYTAVFYLLLKKRVGGVLGTFGALCLWLSSEREAHDDHAQVRDVGEEDWQEDGLRRAACGQRDSAGIKKDL